MRVLVVAILLVVGLSAQARNERTAPVGMRAYIEQLVVPGTELAVAAAVREDPVALRIKKVWPHGNQFRYDFEWTGLEPGKHDLRRWLVRKDGSALTDVPAIEVVVKPTLADSVREPSEPDPLPAPRLAGYRTQQIAVGILWGIGLIAILFVGRKRRRKVVAVAAKPTLADRLRPLVEAVASDKADTAAKAELERLLVSYWRLRLDLRQEQAAAALATIRKHAEAGALLRQVELWLHAPEPSKDVDLAKLLAPYRDVTADSLAPIARQEGS